MARDSAGDVTPVSGRTSFGALQKKLLRDIDFTDSHGFLKSQWHPVHSVHPVSIPVPFSRAESNRQHVGIPTVTSNSASEVSMPSYLTRTNSWVPPSGTVTETGDAVPDGSRTR